MSDQNVEDLRQLLADRAAVGLKKYGVTTMRTDLSLRDWLQHALEEALDKAVYLRAAIRKIDDEGGTLDPIPKGVYYWLAHGAFYDAKTLMRKDSYFYECWIGRCKEFPTHPRLCK